MEEGYIKDEDGWTELKKSREMTSHTYDEETANEIAINIIEEYHGLFIQLETRLQLEKIRTGRARHSAPTDGLEFRI